jgi:hypothetical protein
MLERMDDLGKLGLLKRGQQWILMERCLERLDAGGVLLFP